MNIFEKLIHQMGLFHGDFKCSNVRYLRCFKALSKHFVEAISKSPKNRLIINSYIYWEKINNFMPKSKLIVFKIEVIEVDKTQKNLCPCSHSFCKK